jgi:Family of unknown function (DUF5338)
MEKLSELLRKSFPAKPESNHPKNRADILMRKDEILEAAAQGWPFRHIWKALRDAGELTCAYSTFMKRLNKTCKQEGSATNEHCRPLSTEGFNALDRSERAGCRAVKWCR